MPIISYKTTLCFDRVIRENNNTEKGSDGRFYQGVS